MTSQAFARAATAGLLALAGAAQAQTPYYPGSAVVQARVISATPVVQPVAVPLGHCRTDSRPSGIGTVVGALLGGLVGSQLGSGNGHIAGAVAGTIGGAVLGNMADQQNGYPGGGCSYQTEQQVSGYDVVYEYGGRQYQTRTAQPPGPWLQVPAPAEAAYGSYGGYGSPAPVAAAGAYGHGQAVQVMPVAPPAVTPYPTTRARSYEEHYGHPPRRPASPPVAAQPYPPTYQQPAYQQPAYPQTTPYTAYEVPPYAAAQPARYRAAPVGVSLGLGSGHGGRVGWGVGLNTGF